MKWQNPGGLVNLSSIQKKSLFAPVLVILGLLTVTVFQNCTNDVGFQQTPSRETEFDLNQGDQTVTFGGNDAINIQYNEVPKDTTVDGGDAVIDYVVDSPNSDVKTVECTLNGEAVDCGTKDRITIPNPGNPGTQTFTIVVTNNNGDVVEEDIVWTVYNRIVEKTKDITVTEYGDKVDIIINIDNSGSMLEEQTEMANKIANFMKPFLGLDYHIAIITTSPIGGKWLSSYDHVDGKFLPLDNSGTYCIKSEVHSAAQAQQFLQNNVVRPLYLTDSNGNTVMDDNGDPLPEGNGWERGIYTSRRAFERDVANNQGDNNCLRADVPKHVILISDERETLKDNSGNDLVEIDKSSGQNLINYVSTHYGAETILKFHSIIVNPFTDEGQRCLDGPGFQVGVEYGQFSALTGGYVGSVCASDYSTQLGKIGEIVSNSALAYNLECVPVANSSGSKGRVIDLSTNQNVQTEFAFIGNKVEFVSELSAGSYRVFYNCYE